MRVCRPKEDGRSAGACTFPVRAKPLDATKGIDHDADLRLACARLQTTDGSTATACLVKPVNSEDRKAAQRVRDTLWKSWCISHQDCGMPPASLSAARHGFKL